MFARATKLKFNEQKYLQISIMRRHKRVNEKVQLAGKRACLYYGLLTTFSMIAYKRNSNAHKVCYTPFRKGLYAMDQDPVYRLMEEGRVKGHRLPVEGRIVWPL